MAKTRARTKKGAFIADDPNTPENEAWVRTSPKKDSNILMGSILKRTFLLPEPLSTR